MVVKPPQHLHATAYNLIVDVYEMSQADAYIRKLKWKRCKHNAAIACLMASMLHEDIMKYHKYIGRMLKWRELAKKFEEGK